MIVVFQRQIAFSQRTCSRAAFVSDTNRIDEQVSIDLYHLVVVSGWFLSFKFDWTERDEEDRDACDSR